VLSFHFLGGPTSRVSNTTLRAARNTLKRRVIHVEEHELRSRIDKPPCQRNNQYLSTRRSKDITMAGRKTIAITDRQFAALQILWQHGPLTVREVMAHLPRGHRQPYTTVLGLLQSMEKAELLTHDEEGLTYRYRPAVSRQQATQTLLRDFVGRFFQGSAEALVLGLVDAQELAPEELREIDARLSQSVNGKKKRRGRET
jgi:predicted transcriptional regulator